MKKTQVMAAVTHARELLQYTNFCYRRTANIPDHKLQKIRPTTPEERRREITDAVVWAMGASRAAHDASSLALAYARQQGITIEEIDQRTKELQQ